MTARSTIGHWSAGAAVTAALLLGACGSSSGSSTTKTSAATGTSHANSGRSALVIGTSNGAAGVYLTGASGRALYLWTKDSNGKSQCSGACAVAWPPVLVTGSPSTSGGAAAADISTITRTDGKKQVTYKGHPLYYFAGDTSAGSTSGQGSNGFGAKWWLVAPSGAAITGAGSASSSSSSSSAAGGYGGY